MSRIISYPYDDSIKAKDAWVGTDEASRQTKQYTAEALAEYLNISGSISIIGQMTYKYGTTPLNGIGTLAVFGGGPDIVAFSAVVKLTLSNQDISNQRVVEFLDLLVGSDILIAEQGAISTFGYYSIDSYAINATDSNYYDLGVTFKSGNGSMRSDRIYEAQNFVLANDATQSPWNTVPDGISYTAANVGIGTVTPSEKLEVSGGIIGDTLFVRNTDGYNAELLSNNLTTNRTFNFPDVGGTLALTTDITSSPWDTVTGGINYANGNVGIGTTSPSYKLEVDGTFKSTGWSYLATNGPTSIVQIGSSNSTITQLNLLSSAVGGSYISCTNSLSINVNNNTSVKILPNGNIGIGTTSPSNVLTIGTDSTAKGIDFYAGSTRLGSIERMTIGSAVSIGLEGANGRPVSINNNHNSQVIIANGGGNVGIGTDSPGSKLSISGPSSGQFEIINSANSKSWRPNVNGNDFYITESGVSNPFVIQAGGNIGIGTTSPGYPLEIAQTGYGLGVKNYITSTDVANSILAGYDSAAVYLGYGYGSKEVHIGSLNSGDVKIRTSGNTIIENGNVGIGTTNPGAKLEVADSGSNGQVNENILVNMPTASNYVSGTANTIGFKGLSQYFGALGGYTNGTPGLGFWNGVNTGTPSMVLIGGNVGIGTTSPAEKLEVIGKILIKGDQSYTYGSEIYSNNMESSFYNKVQSQSSAILSIIGDGTFKSRNVYAGANIGSFGNGQNVTIGAFAYGNVKYMTGHNSYNHTFKGAYSNDLMTILGSGNVGIGTTSPDSKLDVTGGDITVNTAGTGFMTFKYGAVGSETSRGSITTDGIDLKVNATADLLLLPSGNVGIGTTSPSEKLEVTGPIGSTKLTGYKLIFTRNANNEIFTEGASSTLTLGTNSVERMRINSAGNVGIGTTSPTRKLDIAEFINGLSIPLMVRNTYSGGGRTAAIGFTVTGADQCYGYVGVRRERPTASDNIMAFSVASQPSNSATQSDEKMFITSAGNVGIGTNNPSQKLEVDGQVLSDGYRLAAMQTAPATRNSAGTLGEIVIDGNHIYVCYATDSWSRVALDTSW